MGRRSEIKMSATKLSLVIITNSSVWRRRMVSEEIEAKPRGENRGEKRSREEKSKEEKSKEEKSKEEKSKEEKSKRREE
jgi:hypothetical protein